MTSNIGETGRESIRIGGRRVSELSAHHRTVINQDLDLKDALDAKNEKRREIIQRHQPVFNIHAMRGAIKQCKKNIVSFQEAIGKENASIIQCEQAIEKAEQRDRELVAAGFEPLHG